MGRLMFLLKYSSLKHSKKRGHAWFGFAFLFKISRTGIDEILCRLRLDMIQGEKDSF